MFSEPLLICAVAALLPLAASAPGSTRGWVGAGNIVSPYPSSSVPVIGGPRPPPR